MSPRPDVDVVSSDAIVDVPVVNSAGDEVGRIAYLMLDVDQGRVAYAVLAHGGALGLAEQLFEVPWRSLRRDAAKERFVLLPIDGLPRNREKETPTDL